jgi:hypothetical protein
VTAMRSDLEKLKARQKEDAKVRDGLAELCAVHSDVFVDVQKRLEGHAQKHKTTEVQLAALHEDHGEKLELLNNELAMARKEARRDTDALGMRLEEALEDGLKEADALLTAAVKEQGKKLGEAQAVSGALP